MKKCVFSYVDTMKKFILALLPIPFLLLPAACAKNYDYSKHLSEVRSDVFCAETDAFTLTLSCVSREHPYAADTVTCPMTKFLEVVLVPAHSTDTEYTVSLPGKDWGGEMSYRSMQDDRYYSESVEEFPVAEVTVCIEYEGQTQEIVATSVKNDHTMSVDDALEIAVEHEKELIARHTADGAFRGEFRVRLLRRDANYYYVGIVTGEGTVSLLLGGESGEVLARRESP